VTLTASSTPGLTDAEFRKISRMVKDLCGINLHEGKKQLVEARLNKRLRQLGMHSYSQYLKYVNAEPNGVELTAMLDALSTNLTSFFRAREHLDYFAHRLRSIPAATGKSPRKLRIWSAGCSTGEEPYSIALTVLESIPCPEAWDIKILATDISTRALSIAQEATYAHERIKAIPGQMRAKYFDCVQVRPDRVYRVRDSVRSLVQFARLNLMDPWPMRGPFDAIFCRNVMIYFDKPTQARLINRFWEILSPGAMLFIGHSESLTGVRHRFRYVQPSVYERPANYE